MKSPLRYQISESDCGSVSLTNCITYLFEREEMPVELIRAISIYSLDCYDIKGVLDPSTGRNLVYSVSRWASSFAEQKRIPLKCSYLKGDRVTIYSIVDCLKVGGCVNLRTFRDGFYHYVMITAFDGDYVYIFDPYFCSSYQYKDNKDIQVIQDNPYAFNRRVKIEYFLSEKKVELALGPVASREVALLYRNDITQERELG